MATKNENIRRKSRCILNHLLVDYVPNSLLYTGIYTVLDQSRPLHDSYFAHLRSKTQFSYAKESIEHQYGQGLELICEGVSQLSLWQFFRKKHIKDTVRTFTDSLTNAACATDLFEKYWKKPSSKVN
jgi:hypothetical protein